MTTLTFGKHKGTSIKDIPADYLEWGVSRLDSPKWRKEFQMELDRRNTEDGKQKDFIKQNINSNDVWELLLREAEKELKAEENYQQEIDCQYDSRIISQKEIEDLAKENLVKYQAEIELEEIENDFMKKWGISKKQIEKIQNAYFNDELQSLCSSTEKYNAANELAIKRSNLIQKIYG